MWDARHLSALWTTLSPEWWLLPPASPQISASVSPSSWEVLSDPQHDVRV